MIKRSRSTSTEPPLSAQIDQSRPLSLDLDKRSVALEDRDPELIKLSAEIDGYEITSRLGRGGFGAVYAARDLALDREVAIKVFTRESDPTAASRFKDEGRLLAKLHHPHIIQVYQMGSMSDGASFLVMERFGSGSIKEHWPRGACPSLEDSVMIIIQLLRALSAAHQVGVVHRDIKEANVLYDAMQRKIKLCDFGIARALGRLTDQAKTTREGVIIGTEHYIAPERYQGRNHDTRSDLYSVGVIFYRLLTGHRPLERYPGEPLSPQMLIYRLFSEPIVGLDEIPERVAHVCERLLEVDATCRYQEASVAAQELERALDNILESVTESITEIVAESVTESLTPALLSPARHIPPIRTLAPPQVSLDRAAQTQTARGLDARIDEVVQHRSEESPPYVRPLFFIMIGVILMTWWTWYAGLDNMRPVKPQNSGAVILRPVQHPSDDNSSLSSTRETSRGGDEPAEVRGGTRRESITEPISKPISKPIIEGSESAQATSTPQAVSKEARFKRSSVRRDASEERLQPRRVKRRRRGPISGSTSRSNDRSSPFIYPHSN